jgi:plastocyanin
VRRALLALTAVALLAAALVPVAQAARGHKARHGLRSTVHKAVKRHAPHKGWKTRRPRSGTPVGPGSTTTGSVPGSSGSGSGSTTKPKPTATPVPTPKPPALPSADPHSVSVRSKEWSFTLSQPSVSAGTVHVQFDNSVAEDAHQLRIRVKGGATVSDSAKVEAGDVVSQDVTLGAGSYVLLCPLPEHEELGMKAELTVTG